MSLVQQFYSGIGRSEKEQVKGGWTGQLLFIINSGHAVLSHNVTAKKLASIQD